MLNGLSSETSVTPDISWWRREVAGSVAGRVRRRREGGVWRAEIRGRREVRGRTREEGGERRDERRERKVGRRNEINR